MCRKLEVSEIGHLHKKAPAKHPNQIKHPKLLNWFYLKRRSRSYTPRKPKFPTLSLRVRQVIMDAWISIGLALSPGVRLRL